MILFVRLTAYPKKGLKERPADVDTAAGVTDLHRESERGRRRTKGMRELGKMSR